MSKAFDVNEGCQNPWTGVVGGLVGVGLCFYLALQWGAPGWWGSSYNRNSLLWCIPVMIFLLMGIIDQWFLRGFQRTARPRPVYHRTIGKLLKSAVWRYGALLAGLTLVRALYFNHPIYMNEYYELFRTLFTIIYRGFVWLGFPYVLVTLYWRGNLASDMMDPGLHLLLWGREGLRGLFGWPPQKHPGRIFRNRRSKIVFLGFLVEIFYFPLMSTFLNNQFGSLVGALNHFRFDTLSSFGYHEALYQIAYRGFYVMDVLLAAGGYALPIRWLNNKIQSVEPTLLGWAAALICYPPFDYIGNTYLPWGHGPEEGIIHAPWLLYLLMVITLLCVALYAVSTMMFGTRFSNLTHRGILTRGPYAWIRHPAYIAKNLSWWTENLPWMGNWRTIFFLAGWNAIYFLRALTEERHLGKDPAYQAYCRKVRYRFIPGIF